MRYAMFFQGFLGAAIGLFFAFPQASAQPIGAGEATTHCYALRAPAQGPAGEGHSYHFVRFERHADGGIAGSFFIASFQKDSQRGSLTGTYQADQNKLFAEASLLAEGSRYTESRTYRIEEDALVLLGGEDLNEAVATLPRVSCAAYDEMYAAFQKERLGRLVNTTDRTRLMKVEGLSDMGFTREDLERVRFMERSVELDNDFRTTEYLLYLMDPMVCGTGGCNLLVINEQGETLANVSVVKLPVYALTPSIDDPGAQPGAWNDLFVWSQGLRRLTATNGRYPSNPSRHAPVLEEQMLRFPEYYQLVFDYLE